MAPCLKLGVGVKVRSGSRVCPAHCLSAVHLDLGDSALCLHSSCHIPERETEAQRVSRAENE